jgi:hypothetical protein
MRSALFLAVLPVLATGCVEHDMLSELGFAEAAAPTVTYERVYVQDVDVTYDGPEDETPLRAATAIPVSNADHPKPDPVPFRLGAGHGTLGLVDLRPCVERGLPPGYLRMRVTFRPNGHVVRAAVESDDPPPREALTCVGQQLELAAVPAFDGQDFTLSRIFYVN